MANGLLESPKQDNDGVVNFLVYNISRIYGPRVLCEMLRITSHFIGSKIHDLIRDLVLNVSQEECLIINQQTVSASGNFQHLTFADRNPLRTPQSFFEEDERCAHFNIPSSAETIERCGNLSRLPKSIHKLQSLLTLRFLYLPKIQIPDQPQGLINLKFLEITKANIVKHLPKLESIEIFSYPKINLLMEPQEIEDQNHHLSLKKLAIHDAPNLRDLPQLLLEASASNLKVIQIVDCPKFEALLEIIDCLKLSCLRDGVERLISLRHLKIQ
ncbi:hypothetical protein CXB51_028928 [Gossypium anomalum]|uniref:Disease resistance protein n=1 Tax=Gossypium anomalum TaxID=47600 RepID=A0A8J5Y7R2_9ROSI|nr:hypothetical protein CXB51_028928 [Gossypium anomalum]